MGKVPGTAPRGGSLAPESELRAKGYFLGSVHPFPEPLTILLREEGGLGSLLTWKEPHGFDSCSYGSWRGWVGKTHNFRLEAGMWPFTCGRPWEADRSCGTEPGQAW